MRCPKCSDRPTSFTRWLLRPGPTRVCEHCGSRLRYRHFNAALVAHGVLGAAWVMLHLPWWGLAIILPVTAVLYPWWFAQYELIA